MVFFIRFGGPWNGSLYTNGVKWIIPTWNSTARRFYDHGWMFGDFQPFFHGKDVVHHHPIDSQPFLSGCFRYKWSKWVFTARNPTAKRNPTQPLKATSCSDFLRTFRTFFLQLPNGQLSRPLQAARKTPGFIHQEKNPSTPNLPNTLWGKKRSLDPPNTFLYSPAIWEDFFWGGTSTSFQINHPFFFKGKKCQRHHLCWQVRLLSMAQNPWA